MGYIKYTYNLKYYNILGNSLKFLCEEQLMPQKNKLNIGMKDPIHPFY